MDPTEQQKYLGYAHNQGAGGALKFMNTGVVGRDGFGTAGTKYMTAVARGQGSNDWTPGDAAPARMAIPGVAPQAAPPGAVGAPQGYQPEFQFEVPTMDSQVAMPQGGAPMPSATPPAFIPQGVAAQPTNPNAIPNAYSEYGESRMEADYQSQQELDRLTMQMQTVPRDAPAYDSMQERRAALLSNLGRNDPAYSGSMIPTPEVLGTDILTNQNATADADLEIATQTQAIQEAGLRGDVAGVKAAEAALTAAHTQKADSLLEAADMVSTREANAREDQARQNADIQSEIAGFDTAIANATTPEGAAALTAGRDAAVDRGMVPPMAPAGQGDNLPAIDADTAAELKSEPKADPVVVTAVTDKVDEAVTIAEESGDAVPNNLTTADATTAGDKAATADPSAFSGALGAIKDFFGDLFDAKELKRMAILYLGARVTGASGGASLAFAGKSYLSRMDAKQTAYEKVAAAGTYTKESVDIFRKTRDYTDLALKAAGQERTGVLQTFYDANGSEVRAERVKVGDNNIWIDRNGNQINPLALTETKPADREAEIQSRMPGMVNLVKAYRDEFSLDAETGLYSNDIVPQGQARELVEWAIKEGVPFEEMGGVIRQSYADMENAGKGGPRVNSLIPFIRQNVIRNKLYNNAHVFVVEPGADGRPPEYVAPQLLETLNRRAANWLGAQGAAGTTENLANQFYTAAITDWNGLTVEEREKFNDGAGEGSNGFYEYADTWLNDPNNNL